MTEGVTPGLRLVHNASDDSRITTGEQVLKDASVLLTNFFASRLAEVAPDDPWRPTIEGLADRCLFLGAARPPA